MTLLVILIAKKLQIEVQHCTNVIDFSTKNVQFFYSKLNLRPKSYLLEIGACNSVGDFIAGEYSTKSVGKAMKLPQSATTPRILTSCTGGLW